MQVQGAATEVAAAEVTRNESVNSMRFSDGGRGWRGGGGSRDPPLLLVFCPPLCNSVQGCRAPLPRPAPTPRSVKDAGDWGIGASGLQGQDDGDQAGARVGVVSAFLSDSPQCRVMPTTPSPWRRLPESQAQCRGSSDQPRDVKQVPWQSCLGIPGWGPTILRCTNTDFGVATLSP